MNKCRVLCLSMVIIVLLFTACNVPQVSQAPLVTAGGPKAWIDAPLDGNRLRLEPYEVVYHGSDSAGVSLIEFSINGETLQTENNGNAAALLVTNKYNWEPQQPGNYTLRARTQNSSGSWSEYAIANVTIIGEATDTPTPTLSPTATLTPTNTPTVTPTAFGALQLVDPGRSVDAFYHGNCDPNQITFTIRATDPSAVQYMFLFYKLQDISSGEFTQNNDGTSMTKVGADTWSITLKYNQIENYNKFSDAWFIYQFVSQGPDKTITRSVQLNDVQFVACGGGVHILPGGIEEAVTPIFHPGEVKKTIIPVINPSE
jgi:hypothetical protein